MANPEKANAQLADSNDNPMIGDAQAKVADAVVAHSLTDSDGSLGATSQAEVEAVLDALGVKINAILDVLEAHGLMKDA